MEERRRETWREREWRGESRQNKRDPKKDRQTDRQTESVKKQDKTEWETHTNSKPENLTLQRLLPDLMSHSSGLQTTMAGC